MGQYDFKRLSFYDFELLSKDLLEKELNIPLENFKTGRDGGIDLRRITTSENIIIQCKHYPNSKFSDLRNSLKKEKAKLAKLKPSRYIVTTSLGLTPRNKSEIMNDLDPYIINPSDIYDCEALNSLLRTNPSIEKNHFKLWLSSTAMIERIFQSKIHNRSEVRKNEIIQQIERYVETASFPQAIEILKENNYCIISGEPGIGKSTLAKILSYKFIELGFFFYEITSISEAYELINNDESQVFYYDDFLGNTKYLDKNEDSEMISFIDYLDRSKNKKLIMTSREYIYNQALVKSEKYNGSKLQKTIIRQNDYHKVIRAKILYNHLYFSELKYSTYRKVLEDKNYTKIINHKTYSPRIIEWMTNKRNIITSDPNEYFDIFIENLCNPKEIWKFSYENSISEISKHVLILLTLTTEKLQVEVLKDLIRKWLYKENSITTLSFEKKIRDSLKELDNTFIKIEARNDVSVIMFQNPSIKDFMEIFINNNTNIIQDFYSIETVYWDQKILFLSNLYDPDSSNMIKESLKDFEETMNDAIQNITRPSLTLKKYTRKYIPHEITEEDKLLTILEIIMKYDKSNYKLLREISKIMEMNIEEHRYLRITVFHFLDLLPTEYIDEAIIQKLNEFSNGVEELLELTNLIILNEKIEFTSKDDLISSSSKCFENNDIFDGLGLDDLEEDKQNIEAICDHLEIDYPDIYDELEDIIKQIEDEIKEKEDMAIEMSVEDYRERRYGERQIETTIEQIFTAFPES